MRLLFGLALIAFLVYLPFLNLLPFAYIRTDLTSGGTDWPSVLFIELATVSTSAPGISSRILSVNLVFQGVFVDMMLCPHLPYRKGLQSA